MATKGTKHLKSDAAREIVRDYLRARMKQRPDGTWFFTNSMNLVSTAAAFTKEHPGLPAVTRGHLAGILANWFDRVPDPDGGPDNIIDCPRKLAKHQPGDKIKREGADKKGVHKALMDQQVLNAKIIAAIKDLAVATNPAWPGPSVPGWKELP